MLLRSFQVTDFRNTIDSEPIAVESDVTCLVGKNESGKTAMLHALELLNPARPVDFSISDQYPRWNLADHRKEGEIPSVVAITATFDLEEADIAAIDAAVGSGTFKAKVIEVSRNYGGELLFGIEVDEAKAIGQLLKTEKVTPALRKRLATGSIEELQASVTEARAAEDLAEAEPEALTAIEAAIESLLDDAETLDDRVMAVLEERLPKFFYFGEYSILPGRVDLTELAGEEPPASTELQTAWALLQLANTDTSLVGTEDFEFRQAELETVSNKLTREVTRYWTQNTELSFGIQVDWETQQRPTGQTAVVRYLDFRVTDRRHGYSNNFSQRSSGFKWFFSFLAAFSEFENQEDRVIVLLDEPALTLHARAQADFIGFINERLAPGHQVIYTTHSPFMIEPNRLERVRIVEDKGPEVGSKVSQDVMATDRDSLFPLQAALGYDIAQNLFLGADDLLVEGTSDFTYLTVLSELLASQSRTGLDARWHIVPCGGATNIATFVALLGSHLEVSVLVDSGTKGIQRLNELSRNGQLDQARLITVDEISGSNNADIEDLFAVNDYLAIANPALGQKLKQGDLPQGDRIVRRLAEKIGDDYDHGVPADHLLRHRDEVLPALSSDTLDNFERLFEKINATLPTAQ